MEEQYKKILLKMIDNTKSNKIKTGEQMIEALMIELTASKLLVGK